MKAEWHLVFPGVVHFLIQAGYKIDNEKILKRLNSQVGPIPLWNAFRGMPC